MFGARGGFLGGTTIAGPTDPYWSNVEMLITARSGTIVDATGKATINPSYDGNGSAVYSTPVKYNPYSFGQQGGRWSISSYTPRNASGVFTFEWWYRSTTFSTTYDVPWLISPIDTPNGNIVGQIGSANTNRWSINAIGGTTYNMTTSSAYDQQWHHVCFTRNPSNLIKFYYDGVESASSVTSSTQFNFGNLMIFGGAGLPPSDNQSNNYWDDLRLTIGVVRYLTNFTPPTTAFPIG